MTTWVQLGSSSISVEPAPKPWPVTRRGGMGPNPDDREASSAAPVGVVNSTATLRPQVGIPASRATTAGAGLGSIPWAARTMPSPVATGLARTSSIPEHLEGGGRAHHVDDGVVAAHLVEVDLVDRTSVEPRLHVGQGGEGGQGPAGHPFGQAGLLDEADDVGVGAHHHVVVAR